MINNRTLCRAILKISAEITGIDETLRAFKNDFKSIDGVLPRLYVRLHLFFIKPAESFGHDD